MTTGHNAAGVFHLHRNVQTLNVPEPTPKYSPAKPYQTKPTISCSRSPIPQGQANAGKADCPEALALNCGRSSTGTFARTGTARSI